MNGIESLKDDRFWLLATLVVGGLASVAVAINPVFAVAGVLAIAVLGALTTRPTWGLPFMYGALIGTDVFAPSITLVVPITWAKVAILAVCGAWIVRCLVLRRWPIDFSPLFVPMLVCSATLFIGLIRTEVPTQFGFLIASGMVLCMAMVEIVYSLADRRHLAMALVGLGLMHIVVMALAIPFGVVGESPWNPDFGRSGGFHGDANTWALFALAGLAPTVAIFDGQKGLLFRLLSPLAIALVSINVMYTVSRAGILLLIGILAPILVVILWRRKMLLAVTVVAVVVSFFLFVDVEALDDRFGALYRATEFESDASMQTRSAVFGYAVEVIQENWLFGVGTGGILPAIVSQSNGYVRNLPHNTYLNILGEQGVVGGIPFVVLAIGVFWVQVKSWLNQPSRRYRRLVLGFLGTTIVFFAMCATLDLVVQAPMYFLLGIALVLHKFSTLSPAELAEVGLADPDEPAVTQQPDAPAAEARAAMGSLVRLAPQLLLVGGLVLAGASQAIAEDAPADPWADGVPRLSTVVRTIADPPRGERESLRPEPVPIGRIAGDITVDGVLDEPGWKQAAPVAPVRSVRSQPPPRPSWRLRLLATAEGLAVATTGLAAEDAVYVGVDPDGSRRGWFALHLTPEASTLTACLPGDAPSPFHVAWRPQAPVCGDPVEASGARQGDTVEALIPWSRLERATDDLMIAWRVEGEDASGTLDPRGLPTDYTLDGAPLDLGRDDRIVGWYDWEAQDVLVTLFTAPHEAEETWRVYVWRNNEILGEQTVTVPPSPKPSRSAMHFDVPGDDEIHLIAVPEPAVPLGPAAARSVWNKGRWAALRSPVFEDTLHLAFHGGPVDDVLVEVRQPGGPLLGRAIVSLPRGTSLVEVGARSDWPRVVEVRAGNYLEGGWITAVRQEAR